MPSGSSRAGQSLRKTEPIHTCALSRVKGHSLLHFLLNLGKILFSILKVHLIFTLTQFYGHIMVAVHPLRATQCPFFFFPVRTGRILKALTQQLLSFKLV